MSRLGRLIQRRKQNRRLSAIKPADYQENGERAPVEQEKSEIPINELLPVEADISLLELTEVRDRIKQVSPERGYSYISEAARTMRVDLSYCEHEGSSRGLTGESEMLYADSFVFEWLMTGNRTGNREDQHNLDKTSLTSSPDEDFELVLRHFWKYLDAEKRRKLIQVAAGLVEGDRKEQ
jgi:hypothetical protein